MPARRRAPAVLVATQRPLALNWARARSGLGATAATRAPGRAGSRPAPPACQSAARAAANSSSRCPARDVDRRCRSSSWVTSSVSLRSSASRASRAWTRWPARRPGHIRWPESWSASMVASRWPPAARQSGGDATQALAGHGEGPHFESDLCREFRLDGARGTVAGAEPAGRCRIPGVDVQARQGGDRGDAAGRRRRRREHADAAARHARRVAGDVAHVGRAHIVPSSRFACPAPPDGARSMHPQPQWLRRIGTLGQRWRKSEPRPTRSLIQVDLRPALDDAEDEPVVRLSRQSAAARVRPPSSAAWRTPSTVARPRSVKRSDRRAGSAIDGGLAAEHARGGVDDRKSPSRRNRPGRAPRERAGRRAGAKVVSGQLQAAPTLARAQIVQRQLQAEPEFAVAGGGGLVQRAAHGRRRSASRRRSATCRRPVRGPPRRASAPA